MAKIVSRGNVTVEFTPEECGFLLRLLGHHVLGGGDLRVISDGIYDTIKGCFDRNIETKSLETQSGAEFIYLEGEK